MELFTYMTNIMFKNNKGWEMCRLHSPPSILS